MRGFPFRNIFVASFLLLLAWLGVSCADELASPLLPGMTASIKPPAVAVGETVRLTLTYTLPEGASLPEVLEIGGLKGLSVLKREKEPGKIVVSILVDRLETWETETLSLIYLDKDGVAREITAPAVSVEVSSNLGEMEEKPQLRPIQGIIPTQSPWVTYLPWAAGILGLAVLATGLLWWHRKKRVDEIRAEILEPPHVRAERHLKGLIEEGLFEAGHIKMFYFSFSEILRQYLGAIRGFGATELTTEEIASYVHSEPDRTVVDLLRQADLVKFADSAPTSARKDEQVMTAFAYIKKTGPTPADRDSKMLQEGQKP